MNGEFYPHSQQGFDFSIVHQDIVQIVFQTIALDNLISADQNGYIRERRILKPIRAISDIKGLLNTIYIVAPTDLENLI